MIYIYRKSGGWQWQGVFIPQSKLPSLPLAGPFPRAPLVIAEPQKFT